MSAAAASTQRISATICTSTEAKSLLGASRSNSAPLIPGAITLPLGAKHKQTPDGSGPNDKLLRRSSYLQASIRLRRPPRPRGRLLSRSELAQGLHRLGRVLRGVAGNERQEVLPD